MFLRKTIDKLMKTFHKYNDLCKTEELGTMQEASLH